MQKSCLVFLCIVMFSLVLWVSLLLFLNGQMFYTRSFTFTENIVAVPLFPKGFLVICDSRKDTFCHVRAAQQTLEVTKGFKASHYWICATCYLIAITVTSHRIIHSTSSNKFQFINILVILLYCSCRIKDNLIKPEKDLLAKNLFLSQNTGSNK